MRDKKCPKYSTGIKGTIIIIIIDATPPIIPFKSVLITATELLKWEGVRIRLLIKKDSSLGHPL
ncbi:MAG: hypothetical protein IAC61_01810 [Firmicutes bacterium]|uniref:Uncharacterized protein n=1 Tax=Candidatus Alloenteromonas pullistercoris TaxID=2840785 RepID=A0A9D9GW46_9FIRM|nr:hypothetical protein [Candidatus Enteromonas pullistercoris]